MPQWRKLHPAYFDSPSVNAMCLAAQRLWQALWCLSDEWGMGSLPPRAIEGFAFSGSSIAELTYGHYNSVDELLAEVAEHCSVIFYEVGHSLCWQCTSWGEHQAIKHKDRQGGVPVYEPGVHKRLYIENASEETLNVPSSPNSSQVVPSSPKTSREGEGEGEVVSSYLGFVGGPGGVSSDDGATRPPAPLSAGSPASSAGADAAHPTEADGAETSDALVPVAEPSPTKADRRGRRLPGGWAPARTAATLDLEAGHDPAWLERELDRFRDHWAAQAGAKGRKSDWDATWRNWLRRADDYAPSRPRGGAREGPDWDRLMAQAVAADARALDGGAA